MASNDLILDIGLLVSFLVQIFPGGPILLVLAEFLPAFVGTGETLGGQHRVGCNEEEVGSHDGIA